MGKLFAVLLPQIISLVSPALREFLQGYLKEAYAKAKTTDNPIDDVLCIVLAAVLSIDLDE